MIIPMMLSLLVLELRVSTSLKSGDERVGALIVRRNGFSGQCWSHYLRILQNVAPDVAPGSFWRFQRALGSPL